MLGILLLIVLNIAIGYGLAVYFHRPELYAIAWRFIPGALPPVSSVPALATPAGPTQRISVAELQKENVSPPPATEPLAEDDRPVTALVEKAGPAGPPAVPQIATTDPTRSVKPPSASPGG